MLSGLPAIKCNSHENNDFHSLGIEQLNRHAHASLRWSAGFMMDARTQSCEVYGPPLPLSQLWDAPATHDFGSGFAGNIFKLPHQSDADIDAGPVCVVCLPEREVACRLRDGRLHRVLQSLAPPCNHCLSSGMHHLRLWHRLAGIQAPHHSDVVQAFVDCIPKHR
jgi:hypothetical protein